MIKQAPKPIFFALCAISLLAAWRPLRETFLLATNDDGYTHLLLIVPMTAALIWIEWGSLKPLVAPGPSAGLVLLSISLLFAGFTRWNFHLLPDERLTGSILALVTWWVGSFVLCFGIRVSRSLLFPLGFLYLAVPMPRFLLNEVVGWLQQGSALAARGMFAVAGVPVSQDGVLLSIPDLTVEVAKECSSIRSSSMLLVTTMLLAQLFLRTAWRKWLVILLAIPVSVAKNGLRIFTIAMLGTKVDPSYLTGRLHHQGGVVFFTIGLGSIFFVLWILHRNEGASLLKPASRAQAS
jgi:exosortase